MTLDNSYKKVIRIAAGAQSAGESIPAGVAAERAENEVCQFCFGTGTRLEPGKGAIICDCRRSNSGEKSLDAARIPRRFRQCSFHNYYPKNDSQYIAHSFANRLFEEYPAVQSGLLFMGPVGVGKTHLAIAILKELIEKKGVKCLFYESGSLLKTIQDSYNPVSQTSQMRVLAPVYEAEVLVLDELGATPPTDWVNDTIYQIINKRYNDQKLTVLTTNFLDDRPPYEPPKEDQPYEGSSPLRKGFKVGRRIPPCSDYTLGERIGTPLRSRLYEMCKKVMIEGEDYRKRVDQRRFDSTTA
ncbi:MAG: ATP-binding protein [Pyrinomonadaceae bacterium]